MTKHKTSVMLTAEATDYLNRIAADFGVSRSAALEMIIRLQWDATKQRMLQRRAGR